LKDSNGFIKSSLIASAKINSIGNFLVLLGIYIITPPYKEFYSIFWGATAFIFLLTAYVIFLVSVSRSNKCVQKIKNYQGQYAFCVLLTTFLFGIFLVLQGVYTGFLSTAHLGSWAFLIAYLEAHASYLYYRPYLFLSSYIIFYLPSVFWLISVGTTLSYTLVGIIFLYGPIIFLRVMELTKLKKRTEALLKQSQQRQKHLQTFLDEIPAKITWLDSDLRYMGVNKLFEKTSMFAHEKSLIGEKFGTNSPDSVITKEIEGFLASSKKKHNCELLIYSNGEMRWHLCLFSKNSFEHGDEVFLITIDIHEKKLMEERLENQKVLSDQASKFASLGEMAAGIAHEINNPLTVIEGSGRILKSLVEKNNLHKDDVLKQIDKILDTNDRIVQIIKGMKDFSRNHENDELRAEKLKDIVESTLLFCTQKFKHNGIILKLGVIPDDLFVLTKPQQLNQVILNFLNNAFDAVINIDGEKEIEVYFESDDEFYIICVADNGKEIVDFSKIFTPYYTTKAPGKGTGIGLSISQKIAFAHNGFIKALQENKKTIFKLFIPKSQR
jgi:signal transduction histidine kinase